MEGPTGLTCVHLMARETFQMVNSTFLVFVGIKKVPYIW